MGWLDSIFGGLSMPDYDKMLKERLETAKRKRANLWWEFISDAQLKKEDEER